MMPSAQQCAVWDVISSKKKAQAAQLGVTTVNSKPHRMPTGADPHPRQNTHSTTVIDGYRRGPAAISAAAGAIAAKEPEARIGEVEGIPQQPPRQCASDRGVGKQGTHIRSIL